MRRRLSHSRSPSPSRGGFSGSSFPKRLTNKEIMARLALAGACVLLVVFLIQFSASQNAPSKLKAVVILAGNSTVLGTIRFEQDNEPPRSNYLQQASNPLHITGKITGLKPGKHGFHVHAFGDLTGGCISAGAHFNPSQRTHGAKDDSIRHEGDLGNIEADDKGEATVAITDQILSLSGENSVLGRALVVHEKVDDLGKGGNAESKKTGNAGARLACGVIGWAKD